MVRCPELAEGNGERRLHQFNRRGSFKEVVIMATARKSGKIYISQGPGEFGWHIEGFIQGQEITLTFSLYEQGEERITRGVRIQAMEVVNRSTKTWRAKCLGTGLFLPKSDRCATLRERLREIFEAGPFMIVYSLTGAGHIEE